jgi:Acyl-CoA-binding protein
MSVEAEFERAKVEVKELPDQPNDVLLNLYALFKQATTGDVEGKRPGLLDLRGRAKYDAWAKLEGRTKEAAMQGYIDLVKELRDKHL